MKNYFFYLLAVFFTGPFDAVIPQQKNTSSQNKLPTAISLPSIGPSAYNDDVINSFLQPIQFTRNGFNDFFSTIFNSSLYAERFLPSCFVHLIDFLEYGKQHKKSYTFYASTFDLFHHRLKESSWINVYALLILIDQLPDYIDPIADLYNERLTEAFKTELEHSMNERSFLLKDRPEQFYNDVTQRILNTLQSVNKDGSLQDVQKSVTTLLEGAFNKLIWSPHEKDEIWKTIKLLAKKCELLHRFSCLSSNDDVNRLLWSLLYRFNYFIECTGAQLPLDFYKNIREDLTKELPSWLTLEEQEEWITTKKSYLDNIVTKGEIKALAYKQGILTDVNINLQPTTKKSVQINNAV